MEAHVPRCHRNRYAPFLFLLLISVCQIDSSVYAGESGVRSGPDVVVGAEFFIWEEFGDADRRLLQETGVRYTLGVSKNNLDRRTAGPLYEVQLKNYFGDLIYDGQTQSGQPLDTNVAYQGNQLRLALGGRVRLDIWPFMNMVDVLGGLGIENWTRNIEDGVTASGVKALGIKETYQVSFSEFGIGLMGLRGESTNYLQVGARKPFQTREGVAIFDGPVTLSPGREWSMFAKYTFGHAAPSSRLGLTLYYESYRFSKSAPVSTSIGGTPVLVLQPKSEMYVFGFQVGYRL